MAWWPPETVVNFSMGFYRAVGPWTALRMWRWFRFAVRGELDHKACVRVLMWTRTRSVIGNV